jgi:hypothetical protein
MAGKQEKDEEIVLKRQQLEVLQRSGKSVREPCRRGSNEI